ncbi:hypothetical protein G6F57_016973 [Rhizopus arrhizus]|nr:hypothetical protein G6F57_016973 [Rhizopus arrhizus]
MRLHRQRHDLQDVGDRHGALMAFRAHQADLRQPRAQAGFEFGQVIDGALGVGAGHDGLDRGVFLSVLLNPAADQIDGGAGECFVGLQQGEVAGRNAVQHALDGLAMVRLVLDVFHAAALRQALAQQRARLALGALAVDRLVVVKHNAVEGVAQQAALLDQVRVAAVGAGGIDRGAGRRRELVDGGDQRAQRRRVVHVVHDHRTAVAFEQRELPRRIGLVDVEGLDAGADQFHGNVQRPGGAHGGQHVLNLEGHAAAMR